VEKEKPIKFWNSSASGFYCGQGSPLKFWKSAKPGVHMRNPDPEQIVQIQNGFAWAEVHALRMFLLTMS